MVVSKPVGFVGKSSFFYCEKIRQYSTLTDVVPFHSVALLGAVCVLYFFMTTPHRCKVWFPGAEFKVKLQLLWEEILTVLL